MKMKKLIALLLAVCMIAALAVGCGKKDEKKKVEFKDPYADITDHFERSKAIYNDIMGEFYTAYQKALNAKSLQERYALMAIAEAKMLGAGVFLPTTSQGGNFAMSRVAPYTSSPILYGNDEFRFHDRIVTTEPIKGDHYRAMKAKWGELAGTGEYEAFVKNFLQENGYTIKDSATFYFTSNPTSWDVLASSKAADAEILVNTYDGLVEYNMENQLKGALAYEWEESEDGLTYTFKIREGVKWVDSQGRVVADVKADDFVAGLQHMLDAEGGLQTLVFGVIKNAEQYFNQEVDFSEVGVKAIDEYTLQYTLETKVPYFMTMLGYGVFAPMSRSYFESRGGAFGDEFDPSAESYKYAKGPDSIAYCGAYLIDNYTPDNTVSFVHNAAHWDAANNNLKNMIFMFTDGSDSVKLYDDFWNGTADTLGLTEERVEIAKEKGTFDDYHYVSDTNATSYCGFLNLYRTCFTHPADETKNVSVKSDAEKTRTTAAMLNTNFRLALVMSIDRAAYNAQSTGEELKLNSLINTYTPGTFVSLPADVTVDINGTATTFKAGTMYGAIMQAQLDADGIDIKVWNGSSSAGFDGWYNEEAAKKYLAKAIEELKAQGIEVSKANPIHIEMAVYADHPVYMGQKQAMKQSIEKVTDGAIIVDLMACTYDEYLDISYNYESGDEANFDLNDGSGWGPDYGDPQTYLDTMLPDGDGYMTIGMGLFGN